MDKYNERTGESPGNGEGQSPSHVLTELTILIYRGASVHWKVGGGKLENWTGKYKASCWSGR